jgi:hypothetical protein
VAGKCEYGDEPSGSKNAGVIYVYCYMTKVGILCISGLEIQLPETGVIEICTLPES